jgi:uncharacterized membrane protein
MSRGHRVVVAGLLALTLLYGAWFGPRGEWFAFAVFAIPPLLLAVATLRARRQAPFWAGVLALAWFSHGVMVAWTRPDERLQAWLELLLALVIVAAASLPGLRARFARRR